MSNPVLQNLKIHPESRILIIQSNEITQEVLIFSPSLSAGDTLWRSMCEAKRSGVELPTITVVLPCGSVVTLHGGAKVA